MTAVLSDLEEAYEVPKEGTKKAVKVCIPQLADAEASEAQPEEQVEMLRDMVEVDRAFRSVRSYYSQSYQMYTNLEQSIAKLKKQWS